MKTTTLLFSFLLVLSLFLTSGQSADSPACGIAQEALASFERIKPGAKRADLEDAFRLDGGIQFASQSRYVFRKCQYIKFDVEFRSRPATLRGGALYRLTTL